MKRCHYFFTSVAFLALLFSGCEKEEAPFNETNSNLRESVLEENYPENKLQEENTQPYFYTEFDSVKINTYIVKFTGRDVKGTGDNITTTFNYTVTSTNETPNLDSFSLEIPGCAGNLSSRTPQQSSKVSSGSIIWNSSVVNSQNYSITFKGNIPLGIIEATVTRGSNMGTDKVLGPCKGVYTLSGSIFIDADEDKIKDASESGIPSISVDLFNSKNQLIHTTKTNETGLYSFKVLQRDYTIAVGKDLLNDANYTDSGNTSVEVKNVTEDRSGPAFNFGYKINSSKITGELQNKVIPVNTEPTKFWVNEIRNAGKKNAVYSKDQIRKFLVSVETILLDEPFKLGTEKEKNALDILTRPLRNDLDFFLQQLLTAELNIVSGRGALLPDGSLNKNFNSALLIYGEAVGCREMGKCSDQTLDTAATSGTKLRISDTDMFVAFNGSGGVN